MTFKGSAAEAWRKMLLFNNARLVMLCGLIVFISAFPSGASAQEKNRVLEQGKYGYENQPLAIEGCEIAGKFFTRCTGIVGDSDWWKELVLVVRNISGKTISAVNINLLVERQGPMPFTVSIAMLLETPPKPVLDVNGKPTGKHKHRIETGDVVRLKGFSTERWGERLQSLGLSDLDRLLLEMRMIYFHDGTGWAFGRDFKLKAAEPGPVSQKRINRPYQAPSEPVEIISILADGKPIKFGEAFTGGEDWLKDLTIRFKNVSGRTLTSVRFNLSFLESKPMGPRWGDSLLYGQPPTGLKIEEQNIRSLPPHGIDQVIMGREQYERQKRALARQEDLSRRTTVEFRMSEAYFADGTRWKYGSYERPDATVPGGFVSEPAKSLVLK